MKYLKPVVLNRNAHRELLFRPMSDFGFASAMHAAPLCASEFFAAAKEYAIVFVRSSEETFFPVVILGLKQDENSFVSANGEWHADYLPLVARSYPFAAVQSTDRGVLQVVIDEAYPGFDTTAGTALFGDTGEPGLELQQRLKFLQAHQQEVHRTRRFGAELGRLDLLTERNAQLNLDEDARFGLNGFWMVDETKVDALGDADLLGLARSGYLALITAHLLSISNLRQLALKLKQSQTKAKSKTKPRAKENA